MFIYYTQYLKYNLNNEISDALGSDGVFILDGRNRLGVMIQDSLKQMDSLSIVQPHFIGFRIIKNGRFIDSCDPINKSKIVYEWIKR